MAEEGILERRILEAAKSELREKGFCGSSMRSVAARAGIAVGTIYNYVNNKDELLCQVLLQSWSELEKGMSNLPTEELPLRAKLAQVGLLQLDFMSYHREIWWEIFSARDNSALDNAGRSLRRQTYERYLELLEQIIHKARETGEIQQEFETLTDKDLANAMIMLINSLKPFWHNSGRRPVPQRQEGAGHSTQTRVKALQEILDVFLYGLCGNCTRD